ncbi:hypothetical protein PMIN06_009584 [Paraphaeosphaeria minitans]
MQISAPPLQTMLCLTKYERKLAALYLDRAKAHHGVASLRFTRRLVAFSRRLFPNLFVLHGGYQCKMGRQMMSANSQLCAHNSSGLGHVVVVLNRFRPSASH